VNDARAADELALLRVHRLHDAVDGGPIRRSYSLCALEN